MESGESPSYGKRSTETEKKLGVEDMETGGWDLRAKEMGRRMERVGDKTRERTGQTGRDTEEGKRTGEKQSDIFLRGPRRLRVASAL